MSCKGTTDGAIAHRQRWMAVLARASADELGAILDRAGRPDGYEVLKRPETGTVMIEGRAGGSGRRFNLGEATVTRAVVRLPDGRMGFAYALGSDRRKSELSAILDAMLQHADHGPALLRTEIEPLAERQSAARTLASRKSAATKVDFFTVARQRD